MRKKYEDEGVEISNKVQRMKTQRKRVRSKFDEKLNEPEEEKVASPKFGVRRTHHI